MVLQHHPGLHGEKVATMTEPQVMPTTEVQTDENTRDWVGPLKNPIIESVSDDYEIHRDSLQDVKLSDLDDHGHWLAEGS
ncbi:hypothetical protein AB0A74_09505 [Saccharothrix sp. NPDC042600]|uniref:hypothetical protein n=1 Tax=Saccharothrix TaxID=2071 RepID=UPI0033CF9E7D